MIEARVFIDNLDSARDILQQERAELQGFYTIHDTIFQNKDASIPLSEEFLRLREIPKNIWSEKPVILALKQTKLRKVGKDTIVPVKLQFDRREDAQKYYEEHFADTYVKDFDFWRVGWQYFMPGGEVVDLEIIEDVYSSIEFKSNTDEDMERLLGKFTIRSEAIIQGPSVVAIKELLSI